MNIGFTIGKFAPLHKGHQFLIEKGINEMDKFYVVIYETDKISISIKNRAKWIKHLYPSVNILYGINPPSQYGLDENSVKIQNDFLKSIIKDIPVTHFYSSEDYGEFVANYFNVKNVLVDKKRINYPISSSMIRLNLNKNIDFVNSFVLKDLKNK